MAWAQREWKAQPDSGLVADGILAVIRGDALHLAGLGMGEASRSIRA